MAGAVLALILWAPMWMVVEWVTEWPWYVDGPIAFVMALVVSYGGVLILDSD